MATSLACRFVHPVSTLSTRFASVVARSTLPPNLMTIPPLREPWRLRRDRDSYWLWAQWASILRDAAAAAHRSVSAIALVVFEDAPLRHGIPSAGRTILGNPLHLPRGEPSASIFQCPGVRVYEPQLVRAGYPSTLGLGGRPRGLRRDPAPPGERCGVRGGR